MTLAEIRDWLRTLEAAENYYIGRLDNKKERSLGVYARPGRGAPAAAIGGRERESYGVRRVRLLLHWNRNAAETENAARRLWELLRSRTGVTVPGGGVIQYTEPAVPEPVAVGTDENGIYEYVIDMNVYYRR